jgi:hypothetical protein
MFSIRNENEKRIRQLIRFSLCSFGTGVLLKFYDIWSKISTSYYCLKELMSGSNFMNVAKNTCPVCKTVNELEAANCVQCGAALNGVHNDSGFKTKTTDMQALTPEMIEEWSLQDEKEAVVPEKGIAFYVDGHSMPAYIDPTGDFVLGRKVGTTMEPLLDLAPFGGYSLGLSRRHVVIRRGAEHYEVLDLGSVNGTWLNEERLVPHSPYPLPTGSHLRLGRMRVHVLYRPFAETE